MPIPFVLIKNNVELGSEAEACLLATERGLRILTYAAEPFDCLLAKVLDGRLE